MSSNFSQAITSWSFTTFLNFRSSCPNILALLHKSKFEASVGETGDEIEAGPKAFASVVVSLFEDIDWLFEAGLTPENVVRCREID